MGGVMVIVYHYITFKSHGWSNGYIIISIHLNHMGGVMVIVYHYIDTFKSHGWSNGYRLSLYRYI